MRLETMFVKEIDEFESVHKFIDGVFNKERVLPEQVFNINFTNYLFEEFDWTMSEEFWSFIKVIANKTNDDHIFSIVLDPNQIEYFYKEFGYFNCVRLPITLENHDYINILEIGPKESPADAMHNNSNIVVWTSPSMKWGIWGQRDYGVSVIAFNKNFDTNDLLPYFNTWKSVDEALNGWMTMEFNDQKVPQKVRESFCINYSDNT